MTAADPSWFYSSLSQVTAAIVGFLGGFLLLRMLTYIKEWGELAERLGDLQRQWVIVDKLTKMGEAEARRAEIVIWS